MGFGFEDRSFSRGGWYEHGLLKPCYTDTMGYRRHTHALRDLGRAWNTLNKGLQDVVGPTKRRHHEKGPSAKFGEHYKLWNISQHFGDGQLRRGKHNFGDEKDLFRDAHFLWAILYATIGLV